MELLTFFPVPPSFLALLLLYLCQIAGGPAHQHDALDEGDEIVTVNGLAVDENR